MAVNFSGNWLLNKERSDDSDELLTALGVGWVSRRALSLASRSSEIKHNGLEWIELQTTAVITRETKLTLDGEEQIQVNPVDNGEVEVRTTIEEDGACVVGRTLHRLTGSTQEIRRYIDRGTKPGEGDTYRVVNKLTVGEKGESAYVGKTIVVTNRFDRDGFDPAVRQRLEAFYKKYNPEKLDNSQQGYFEQSFLDQTLEKYKGRYEELFAALVEKYGPEPSADEAAEGAEAAGGAAAESKADATAEAAAAPAEGGEAAAAPAADEAAA